MYEFLLRVCKQMMPRVCGFAIALAVLLGNSEVILAAPVTFQFEAEVASIILSNGGSDLLPAATVGDTLLATFQFESTVPGLNHPQSRPFEFVLSGAKYTSPNYSITVRDQSSSWIPFPDALADPENTLIDDRGPGGISDTLWIGAFDGSSGDFDTVLSGANGGIEWHAPILLAGDQSTFDGNVVPTDTSVWNSMIFRELAIEFTDVGTSKTTRIGAFITNVSLVPEPAGVNLVSIVGMMSFIIGRFQRGLFRIRVEPNIS